MEILEELKFTSETYEIIFPLALIVLDVLTGLINAWVTNDLKSKKMREGLGHKAGEIAIIVLGFLINLCLGLHSVYLLAILYVCIMEVLSVLENVTELGFPIPEAVKNKIRKVLNTLNKEGD